MTLLPYVRHMLLCESVQARPQQPKKLDLLGLINSVSVSPAAEFPVQLTFSAFLVLSEGRGDGEARVVVIDADSDEVVHLGDPHVVKFGSDPLQTHSVSIQLVSCTIPHPGLFMVQFWYEGIPVEEEPLRVEVRS